MYAFDHSPPHFHIVSSDGRDVAVAVEDLSIIAGAMDRREIAEALAWARNNKDYLLMRWNELS